MNRNGKKVLILVLTLSLAATFVAPLPVIRGQDESPDVAWVDDWKEFERDSTVYFEGVKATTGVSAFATIHEAISIGNIPAGAVKDTADNPLPEDFALNFTTMAEPDTIAPELKSTDPANGAVDVPPDKVIKVTFTEEVVKGNAFAAIVLKNAEGKELGTKVEISGSDLTIKSDAPLGFSTKYTVTIPAGAVNDAAGNPLKVAYTFSFTTAGLPTQTFDDIQGHWAQHDIELMAGLGIAKGVGDNKFNPDGNVTRAEFVALLVRSFGVPIEPVSETSFKDVPPDAWFAAEVEAAYKGGIAIGFEDGTFRPYAQVNREQIAVFIVRAMNWTVEDEEADALLSKFTDQAKISSWAKEAVAVAVQKGIVLGRPDGNFDPQANATRAEAVVMLKRVLQAAGVIPPKV
ncbi:S-layer homology domain-containing protein [Coprothermobacter proteolyticus]|uniref:S-layer homology domain-containing protein n=1 Tax=Coprothermobacter proteolyticus TaxID=35786 RepID=UPI000D301756|nr:S-layer homology domain-containing protein [Coprothermobacter proteolyticus]